MKTGLYLKKEQWIQTCHRTRCCPITIQQNAIHSSSSRSPYHSFPDDIRDGTNIKYKNTNGLFTFYFIFF